MRSSVYVLFFVLQLFIISVKCGPLPSTEEANDELVKDEKYDVSKYAKQVDEGVQLISSGGYVDLVIYGDSLFVYVDIKNCFGKVLFCYPAKPGRITKDAKGLCSQWNDFCGFQVIGTDDEKIAFTTVSNYPKSTLKDCSNDIQMQYHHAIYCKDIYNEDLKDQSCNAAISVGVPFRIHVENAECSVIIKNATIYVPPTTLIPSTIPPPTLLPGPSSNNDTTKNEKTSEASTETWAWIVLAVVAVLIVVGIIAGILLCWKKEWCMFEKTKKSVKALPPPVTPIVTTTVEKVAVSAKSKKEKPKPPKLVVEVPSKEPSKKPSPTLSLAPTPPTTKSVKKPKEKKGASPAKNPKDKKPKTPPPPVAAKKELNEKKVGRVSPGKKTKESSTQSYTPPFCLVPIRPPSPPKEPLVPGYIVHTNRKPGQKGQYANSLELPSYSGGKLVPPKITAAEIEKAKMEEWEQERQLLKELKERNNS